MQIKKTTKQKNSKLLKLTAETKNNQIKKIKISGDFFAYPEKIIAEIEAGLKNCQANKKKVIKKTREIIKKSKAKLFGLTPEMIGECFEEKK